MLTTTYAGLSDIGRKRSRNDDRWGSDPAQGLYIVADGVGSTSHGYLSAELVVETLPAYVGRHLAGVDLHDGQVSERMGRAVVEACTDLYERSRTDSRLSDAGTTLVTAVVGDSRAVIAHLGDSRAYLYRDGQVKRLTSDHTIVQAVIDAGEITPEEAARNPNRSVVTRHVMMTPPAKPDVNVVDLQPGDRILLCSDGLHGVIDDAALAAILGERADPADACRALIEAANQGGGPDNITAVVIDTGPATSTPASGASAPTVAMPTKSAPEEMTAPTVAAPIRSAQEPPPPEAPVPPAAAPPSRRRRVPSGPPGERVPPRARTAPPQPHWPRRHRRLKLGLLALVAVLLAGAAVGYFLWPRNTASQTTAGQPKPSTQAASSSAQSTRLQPLQPGTPPQQPKELPFGGLNHPKGVAVDSEGNVYVIAISGGNLQVFKLAPGASSSDPLPFGGLVVGSAAKPDDVIGIAVEGSGKNIYVTDRATTSEGRVMKLTQDPNAQEELPFWKWHNRELKHPAGVTLDSKGDVYAAYPDNGRVMKLSAGAKEPTELHFAGADHPIAIAVAPAGDVYVIDHGKNRIFKLAQGSRDPEPITVEGLEDPTALTVDALGNVYIADRKSHQLVKLSASSGTQIPVAITGLANPTGVAVDARGTIYVTDGETGKVLTLPAQ